MERSELQGKGQAFAGTDNLGQSPEKRPVSSRASRFQACVLSGESQLPPEVSMTFCPVPWNSSSQETFHEKRTVGKHVEAFRGHVLECCELLEETCISLKTSAMFVS